jgi:hypothetical protein
MYFEKCFCFEHLLTLELSVIVTYILTFLWMICHLNTWTLFLVLFEVKTCILLDAEGSKV